MKSLTKVDEKSREQFFFIHLNLTSKNRIIVKTEIVGVIIRISKVNKAEDARKALNDLTNKNRKKKTIADFYGKLPGAFGDGLEYQKKMRNEWQ